MASNSFGQIFKITTWGESHGKAIGVVIDGCPAGLEISTDDINLALAGRAPGKNFYTSPRSETDLAEIYSGVFEGITTGAPISIIIYNKDADSSKYEPIKDLLRPGHANFTYHKKYGVFDYRGGGRASARETACRVAAGAVAQKILEQEKIEIYAYIKSIGHIVSSVSYLNQDMNVEKIFKSPVFSPVAAEKMMQVITDIKKEGDSFGGVIEFVIKNIPAGLGDPVYEKIEANLAKAMMSIPATKGIEIGEGFMAAQMRGSTHNDLFSNTDKKPTLTNHAGGILGGITTGMPVVGRVAFKPTSSINKSQKTISYQGEQANFDLPAGSRHDPCVAIRAVPVVSAMCQLVIADALLLNRCSR